MSDTRHETPEPFKVDIPERSLIDLDERLRRWHAPIAIADNGSWASGTDPDFLAELVDHWRTTDRTVVAISNEVGSGVVPPTYAGRLFRDQLGILNARLAAESDEVWLVTAGLAQRLR